MADYLCDESYAEVKEVPSKLLLPGQAARYVERLYWIMHGVLEHKRFLDDDAENTTIQYKGRACQNLPNFLGKALRHMTVYDFLDQPMEEGMLEPMFENVEDVLYDQFDFLHTYQLVVAVERLKRLRSILRAVSSGLCTTLRGDLSGICS